MPDYSIYLEELAATLELEGPSWKTYSLKSSVSAGAMVERLAQELRSIREQFGGLPGPGDIVRLPSGERFGVTWREFKQHKGKLTMRLVMEMRPPANPATTI
jgi:hypothetical protein